MRESTDRGAAIDISDFERRLRASDPAKKSVNDPLSELARLMQNEDQGRGQHRYDEMFAAESPKAPQPQPSEFVDWRDAPAQAEEDAFGAELRGAFVEAHSPTGHDAPDFADEPYADHAFSGAAYPDAAHEHDQNYAQGVVGHDQQHAAGTRGDWAEDQNAYLDYGAEGEPAGATQPPARRLPSLRPWHAVAAIVLVATGGIGWSFAHRGGSIGSRDIATINAPDGPTKVQPAAEADASADKPDATVLDRHETTQVKQVVSHQEQAVDPKVAPRVVKLGAGPVDAEHEPPQSIAGPEPKRIKTVSVRPDGSLIEGAAIPAAVVKATGAPARDAAAKKTSTTPKSPVKPATTPRVEAKAKPKAPEKVAAVDDNAEEAAPATKEKIGSGGFAVQFGAATTEAEAHSLVTKVATKYGSQLGGHHPTFKMAKVGEKTVYRVRVGGISKEAANAVCGKVKASGGNCFVAGN